MKSISANLKAHIQGDSTTLATCWKLALADGSTVLGFTDHVENLVIDSVTYSANSGFSHSEIDQSLGMNPDNLEIAGFLDSPSLDSDDLRAGLLNNAEVWIFIVDYTTISDGILALDYGNIGEVTMLDDDSFVVEFRSLMQRLDQEIGRKYSRFCKVDLGSTECGIDLSGSAGGGFDQGFDAGFSLGETWTKTGTVTSVTNNRTWVDSTRTETANWFQFGVITWTSGANSGLSFDVKSSTATGTISQVFSCPFTIATGDGYSMHAGCNHLLKMFGDTVGTAYTGDCRSKFNNVDNFRGEPEITGLNFVLSGAKQ
jgi:uncharacterized phage protein (TIGR02218 family)